MIKKWFVLAVIAFCGNVTPARAALVTYLSQSDFLANAGPVTLEDFNSLAPQIITSPGSHSFSKTIGEFALWGFGNGDFVGIGGGSNKGNINGSSYLHFGQTSPQSGSYIGDGDAGPDVTLTFDTPQKAFGFTWIDTDLSDSYKLIINGVEFAGPPFSTSGTGRGFFGVVASGRETFTTVSFVHLAGDGMVDPFGIDDVIHAGLYTVPEPSSIVLACTALPMGLGLAWKRRRKARAAV